MIIKEIRKAAEILGRGRISERILEIANDIVNDGSYKKAVICAGKIKVLFDGCTFDEYWHEKSIIGEYSEHNRMEELIRRYNSKCPKCDGTGVMVEKELNDGK